MKDQLFNADSLRDLASEYQRGLPDFDADQFHTEAVAGLPGRELLERLEWIADCVEAQLAPEFPEMAQQLEAAMPPALDPTLSDNDFGRFIHAVPGILAVRHGLDNHRERALVLLHNATKRFSMEFYIRPFLNRWPDETFEVLLEWAEDSNYHVRRLVSEGTRPKLPWAKKVEIDPLSPLPLLEKLHADPTRYVTRSVANHLNDISKIDTSVVTKTLKGWHDLAQQEPKELNWMTRHALRTAVKKGDADALALQGFHADAPVHLTELSVSESKVAIGDALEFNLSLKTDSKTPVPVLVDYEMRFHRPNGREGRKVFKLKQTEIPALGSVRLSKRHVLKGNATTFTLYPGRHTLAVQVNGRVQGEISFELVNPT
ncbi:hypothetical protein [Shimia isoporae]|uniref:hypothetical protein n=1 Tax=Shimia isoporae TaxID=647720 RepID=UPI00313346A5